MTGSPRAIIWIAAAVLYVAPAASAPENQFGRVLKDCLTRTQFASNGGQLQRTMSPDFHTMESSFPGLFERRGELELVIHGAVDESGLPDLFGMDHTATCYPSEVNLHDPDKMDPCMDRTVAFARLVVAMRYLPPVVRNKHVCVLVDWDIKYDPPTKIVEP